MNPNVPFYPPGGAAGGSCTNDGNGNGNNGDGGGFGLIGGYCTFGPSEAGLPSPGPGASAANYQGGQVEWGGLAPPACLTSP